MKTKNKQRNRHMNKQTKMTQATTRKRLSMIYAFKGVFKKLLQSSHWHIARPTEYVIKKEKSTIHHLQHSLGL